MSNDKTPIDEFKGRLFILEWSRRSCQYASIWFIFTGTVTLVLRALMEPNLLILFNMSMAGLLLTILFAHVTSRKKQPSDKKLHAYMDKFNNCGGLLISNEEMDIGAWSNKLSTLSYPKTSWHYKQPMIILTTAVIFTLFSFQLPVSSITQSVNNLLNIDKEVGELAGQIDILKEEEILEEEDAIKLQEELKKLHENAEATDPIKTWEALDHLAGTTRQKAEEATEDSIKQLEQMANLESLAELLSSSDAQSLDKSTMNESMQELSKMMKESLKQSEKLKNTMSQDLMQAIKAGNLSNKDLKQIKQSLSQCQKGLQDSIMRMLQNRMIDPRSMKIAKQASKKSMNKLSHYLKQNCKNKKVCEGLGQCMKPGSGGVSRGKGDAEMTYKDPSNTTGTNFKPVILPPAQMADLRTSQQLGISYAEPDTEGSEQSQTGGMSGVKVDGGAGHTHTLLPKHKRLIQTYFNREQ